MKKNLVFIICLWCYAESNAQNVGINTTNPQEQLHLRSDSTKLAIRLDSKKSAQGGFDYFTTTATPSNVTSVEYNLNYEDWTDLNHNKLINSDDNRMIGPQMEISPDWANGIKVQFSPATSIPSNAQITDVILNAEWRRIGTYAGNMGFTITLNKVNNNLPLLYYGFQLLSNSTDVNSEYNFQQVYNQVTPDMVNLSDIMLVFGPQASYVNGISRLEIDRLWLEIEYKLPTTNGTNVYWSVGAKEGEFKITNSQDLNSKQYLSIDETGTTILKSLKIPKNAGAGKVLTSNNEGKAFWADLPQQNIDQIWLDKQDTAFYGGGPVQINNSVNQAALIFDKGESRLNNGTNMIETDNRLLNVIIDANNDQVNEQFNIYKDSTEVLAQNPAVRFNLGGNDSWINGGGKLGVGNDTPVEKLDVSGAIKIGDTANSSPQAGTVRWNAATNDFEGYTGAKWLPLTSNVGWGSKTGEEDQSIDGTNKFGYNVDVSGINAIVSDNSDSIRFYEYDGSNWIKKASFRSYGDEVSIHVDNAIARDENSNGINVFEKVNGIWGVASSITPIALSNLDLYGNTIVVGLISSELAYVYSKIGNTWVIQDTLMASDGMSGDHFGTSVSVFEDRIIVGASAKNNGRGAVYVYEKTGNNWNEVAILEAADGQDSDFFGADIDLKGNYFIAGAYSDDVSGVSSSGSAYIFKKEGTAWLQQSKLEPTINTVESFCGHSVKLNGSATTATIGCPQIISLDPPVPYNNGNGRVHVFSRDGLTWAEEIILSASDGQINEGFGFSTSIHNNTILIGTPGKNNNSGGIYFFQKH